MLIMDREETFEHMKNKVKSDERIIAPRYGDGEYLLMSGQRNVAKETLNVVGPLLKRALKTKSQLVCTVKKLEASGGVWYQTCKYVMEKGGHDLYGAGAWIRWDFVRNSDVLSTLFRGSVLIVAGYGDEAEDMFKDIQPGIKSYTMPKKQASSYYNKATKDISNICSDYDNVLFSCGPIGKVILSDIIDKTNANLVDVGSLLPAILSLKDKTMLKTWSMGGYKKRSNLDKLVENLLRKI